MKSIAPLATPGVARASKSSRRQFLTLGLGAAAAGVHSAPAQAQANPALPPLRVVMQAQAAPISFNTDAGQPSGFAVELFRRVAAAAGVRVQNIVAMPRKDALQAFRSGAADVMLAAHRHEGRDAQGRAARLTRPFQSLTTVLVSRQAGRHFQTLDQCRGQRLAVGGEQAMLPHLLARYADIKLLKLDGPGDVLQAVAQRRADAGLVASELVMGALQSEGAPADEALAITGLITQAHSELAFMLRAELGAVRDALDHALGELPEDWLMAQRERWFGLPASDSTDSADSAVARHANPRSLVSWQQVVQTASPAVLPALLLAGGAGVGSMAWIARLKREIQRRREAERHIAASRDEAALAAAHRKRFITFLSHESRTLVATMVGGLELAARDLEPGLRQRILDGLRANAAGLKQLLDESLDAAAIDAGAVQVQREVLAVGALLRQVHEEAAMLATAKYLWLKVELDSAVPVLAIGDRVRLAQALRNLVFNALKFTPQGGVRVRATQRHVDGQPRAAIEVIDTGPGLSAAQIAQLFQPFAQLADHGEGSGLGLAISRELVQRMGGSLTVHSTPGRGSTFTIELPAPPEVGTAMRRAPEPGSGLAIA
jgi:two-component system, NarL family, sensor histidine kinase EvgS